MLAGLAVTCLVYPALSASERSLMSGAATQDLADPTAAATAAGCVNSIGSVGQMLSPLVVAGVIGAHGSDSLVYLFVVVAAAGALVLATRRGEGKPLTAIATAEAGS